MTESVQLQLNWFPSSSLPVRSDRGRRELMVQPLRVFEGVSVLRDEDGAVKRIRGAPKTYPPISIFRHPLVYPPTYPPPICPSSLLFTHLPILRPPTETPNLLLSSGKDTQTRITSTHDWGKSTVSVLTRGEPGTEWPGPGPELDDQSNWEVGDVGTASKTPTHVVRDGSES
ncbi:Hypothetical predicted protein [Marmota monax]|uniref:Uncharacterized protein n=1 Tax=Marmota monax TaxID=9995 RepID=A0A5E4CKW6_MARMO|nr:Hypothetical predicted protein [Marmota monax]